MDVKIQSDSTGFNKMLEKYDVICVGTSFATSFFLVPYLKKASPTARVLVLERGRLDKIGRAHV